MSTPETLSPSASRFINLQQLLADKITNLPIFKGLVKATVEKQQDVETEIEIELEKSTGLSYTLEAKGFKVEEKMKAFTNPPPPLRIIFTVIIHQFAINGLNNRTTQPAIQELVAYEAVMKAVHGLQLGPQIPNGPNAISGISNPNYFTQVVGGDCLTTKDMVERILIVEMQVIF